MEKGAVVKVTGTVKESFNVRDVEEEYGLELNDSLFADLEEQHYVVADSVIEPSTADSRA